MRGGCYKCDGTGWVPERQQPISWKVRMGHDSSNSRVSNANYRGYNLGAHFRDTDGRIGSIPEFDDYGEEGNA